MLIQADTNLDYVDPETGHAVLHAAAKADSSGSVQLLLDDGADVDVRNRHGETPLLVDVRKARLDIIHMLIDAQASVNVASSIGITPLHATCYPSAAGLASSIIPVLLMSGANVNACDDRLQTPLHHAAKYGSVVGLDFFLVAIGEDTKIQDHIGRTLLHYSCEENHRLVVRFLLRENANPSILDHDGQTPLDLAYKGCNWHVVKMIVDQECLLLEADIIDGNSSWSGEQNASEDG